MVRLHEYQGKQVLSSVKIPVPAGKVASTPQRQRASQPRSRNPWLSKPRSGSQAASARRIKFANTPEEAEKAAQELIGAEIKGLKVEKVLVEEKLDVAQEYYAGVIVDPGKKNRSPIIIFSSRGGTG